MSWKLGTDDGSGCPEEWKATPTEQRIRSNQDGRPGADEDTQSYFPIHLGCTRMN